MGSLYILQGILTNHGSNPRLLHSRCILYQLKPQEYWSGQPFPSPADLPNPGIKTEYPALQGDSLPSYQGSTLRGNSNNKGKLSSNSYNVPGTTLINSSYM